MLTHWRRERAIRGALRRLAQQRVLDILKPDNIWVVEYSIDALDAEMVAAVRTCHLRGWAEVVQNAVPTTMVDHEGFPRAKGFAATYRLTEAGWAQLRRTHEWLIATFIVAFLGLAVSAIALLPEARRVEYGAKFRQFISPTMGQQQPSK